jgi:nucleotidyltransferase/DNA polymerase involved in DNA repair
MPPQTQTKPSHQVSSPSISSLLCCLWVADLPSWALKRLEPELKDSAVIILEGRRVRGTCEQARKAGVRIGDAIDRARGLCPSAVMAQLEVSALQAAWEAALETLYKVTPWLETPRLGLAFAAGLGALEAEALASELDIRVGASSSRGSAWLASIASSRGKARVETSETTFLARVPVYLLRGIGVGEEVIKRLELFGLKTLGDITERTTPKSLEAQFGKEARALIALLRGGDSSPVALYSPPSSVKTAWVFDPPALEPHEIEPILTPLLARAIGELGGLYVGTVTVTLETMLGASTARQVLKQYTQNAKVLLLALERLTRTVMTGLEVSRLEILFSDLIRPTPVQSSLFGSFERPDVQKAIQVVHQHFPEKIGRLEIHRPKAVLSEERFRFEALTGERVKRKNKAGKT